jgi:hypothetical protein
MVNALAREISKSIRVETVRTVENVENLFVLGLTDTLTRLFSNKIWPIVLIRRCSLWICNDISPIRSLVLRHMQGLTGKAPRIKLASTRKYSSVI